MSIAGDRAVLVIPRFGPGDDPDPRRLAVDALHRRLAAGADHRHREARSRSSAPATSGCIAGAIGYWAFDNAVLWATFHAFGYTPEISIVLMGYLIGQLGGLLPIPGGIGGIDGGLIGTLIVYGAPAAVVAAAVLAYRDDPVLAAADRRRDRLLQPAPRHAPRRRAGDAARPPRERRLRAQGRRPRLDRPGRALACRRCDPGSQSSLALVAVSAGAVAAAAATDAERGIGFELKRTSITPRHPTFDAKREIRLHYGFAATRAGRPADRGAPGGERQASSASTGSGTRGRAAASPASGTA